MLKKEFIENLECIVAGSRNVFYNDKPAIRMLFNDVKDSLHKDGMITDNQVFSWCITDKELSKLIKISKG